MMRSVKVTKHLPENRMFESDFFEFFSHIHPWQPPAVFLPVIAWTAYRAIEVETGPLYFALLFFVGFLNWSLMEYWLHRLLFHFEAKSKLGKRMFWLLHGVHHDWPNDKLRLVFPPTLSVPLAILFWGIYTAVFGEASRYAAFCGITTGYLSYDMIHYYVHHFAPKNRVAKYLRRYHLAHHFKDHTTGFGVSMPLWDFVFGTKPKA